MQVNQFQYVNVVFKTKVDRKILTLKKDTLCRFRTSELFKMFTLKY